MWLNDVQVNESAIGAFRESLLTSCPNHIVIDNLFNEAKLDEVMRVLQQPRYWQTQKHTYSALYVDSAQWQKASNDQRFVQRDVWQREAMGSTTASSTTASSTTASSTTASSNIAQDFLSFLRGDEFMSLLSRIFDVQLTDMNVEDPEINTNYFRLGATDFVGQHADDSPGREVCMLLYLNKDWKKNAGGELSFLGKDDENIHIAPLYNRCVLFDPSSRGSEHWVERWNAEHADKYRYNVTSWYWSE